MSRGRTKQGQQAPRRGQHSDPGGELSRLRRELEEARALLRQVELGGTAAGQLVVARRLSALEEERQVARGQAVEAALARSRAEAELKALRDALRQAPGVRGWLLRKLGRGF